MPNRADPAFHRMMANLILDGHPPAMAEQIANNVMANPVAAQPKYAHMYEQARAATRQPLVQQPLEMAPDVRERWLAMQARRAQAAPPSDASPLHPAIIDAITGVAPVQREIKPEVRDRILAMTERGKQAAIARDVNRADSISAQNLDRAELGATPGEVTQNAMVKAYLNE